MYHHPRTNGRNVIGIRASKKRKGVHPKYLIRYCDDRIILTTMLNEAIRILSYLHKYYKYRLKLNLSKEKTVITGLTENRAKFLRYEFEAKPPRTSPGNKGFKGLVGKFYPSKEKAIAKTKLICEEILKLRSMEEIK